MVALRGCANGMGNSNGSSEGDAQWHPTKLNRVARPRTTMVRPVRFARNPRTGPRLMGPTAAAIAGRLRRIPTNRTSVTFVGIVFNAFQVAMPRRLVERSNIPIGVAHRGMATPRTRLLMRDGRCFVRHMARSRTRGANVTLCLPTIRNASIRIILLYTYYGLRPPSPPVILCSALCSKRRHKLEPGG